MRTQPLPDFIDECEQIPLLLLEYTVFYTTQGDTNIKAGQTYRAIGPERVFRSLWARHDGSNPHTQYIHTPEFVVSLMWYTKRIR